MPRDDQRRQWTADALQRAGLSAVVCALPHNVLMLSGGYWPTIGTAVAVATADGRVAVVVPEDEADDVPDGAAEVVRTFKPAGLADLHTADDAVVPALADAVAELGISPDGRWGYEHAADTAPHSYVAMHLYRPSLRRVLRAAVPRARLARADDPLGELRSRCTPTEVAHVRRACQVAGSVFTAAGPVLQPGVPEQPAAAVMASTLADIDDGRSGGAMWAMSGPNSAKAAGAFARSSDRPMSTGELVLIHCNNQVGGYWTDVTRTFCLGQPTDDQRRMYTAVFAARAAALAAIHPGAKAADVDHAARSTLAAHGYDDRYFKHPTGHGVPFVAIAGTERPRIHPRSPDVLQVGSVFNVEPAVYVDGVHGLRHCDVVAVTESGVEVLTPWLADPAELWL